MRERTADGVVPSHTLPSLAFSSFFPPIAFGYRDGINHPIVPSAYLLPVYGYSGSFGGEASRIPFSSVRTSRTLQNFWVYISPLPFRSAARRGYREVSITRVHGSLIFSRFPIKHGRERPSRLRFARAFQNFACNIPEGAYYCKVRWFYWR